MSKSKLAEYKEIYTQVVSKEVKNLPILEIAHLYNNELDSYKKDMYAAALILNCWPALEKLYYKQNTKILSEMDCYDIFMDSFLYVMEKQVWTDENNSLYQDKDAILKSMYVVTESRRKNFFIAQNRQKRHVNQYPVSLDTLSEEFQEGYFSSIIETYNFERGWEKEFIATLWDKQLYISAVIFDVILHADVIDDNGIDKKKIKKYIKNMSDLEYNDFIIRNNLKENYEIYENYIEDLDDRVLYVYIDNALQMFKRSEYLNRIREDVN